MPALPHRILIALAATLIMAKSAFAAGAKK